MKSTGFLPITRKEMIDRGWDSVDIVLITGDAYVDHPSFGSAVIGRVLESKGFRVGIIAMPDWRDPGSIDLFGKPNLFFAVTGGAIDSMLACYTAFKRKRSDDPYAPGGRGNKPERAVIVYCNLIKKLYKDVPIVIGGIEASMRRIAHYDFWDNKVRRSIIEDSRADILVYGMGEKAIAEIAERLSSDKDIEGIPGTAVMAKNYPAGAFILPAEEDAVKNKSSFIDLYKLFYLHQQKTLAQPAGKRFLVHYPAPAMSSKELDDVYALPYKRSPHPLYKEPVPAFDMIKNSVTCHRGCVSGCSFCSLSLHQGRRIISRSRDSVLGEVKAIADAKDFKGHITDIGGPSANMYGFRCSKGWKCGRESCLYPSVCPNLLLSVKKWIDLLAAAAHIKGVKSVTIGSGIRYDIFMMDPDHKAALKAIVKSHISGQLKIAPESTSPRVLRAMRKIPVFELMEFIRLFKDCNSMLGKKQYLIPYFMSCHPGSLYEDMKATREDVLALFGFVPDQVQMFIPLPMTLSSVIYYTGIDPVTGESFKSVGAMQERKKQHGIWK
ncbi:MAG: YgiQ family radical SAM protein [Spirochaetota bacterium]